MKSREVVESEKKEGSSLHRLRGDAINTICLCYFSIIWKVKISHAIISKILNWLESDAAIPRALQNRGFETWGTKTKVDEYQLCVGPKKKNRFLL